MRQARITGSLSCAGKNPQESSALLQVLRRHYSHSLGEKEVEYGMIFRAQGKLSSILPMREVEEGSEVESIIPTNGKK